MSPSPSNNRTRFFYPSRRRIRQGIAFSILGLSALICTPIAGALLARYDGEFTGAIIFAGELLLVQVCAQELTPLFFAGCCSAVGSVGMGTTRFLRAREMGSWKV